MSRIVINFREWTAADVRAPASGDAAFLMGIAYDLPVQGRRKIDVFGVAFGSASTEVTAQTDLGTVTANAAADQNGRLSAQLELPSSVRDGIIILRNIDPGASGHDRAAFAFAEGGQVELAQHSVYPVDPQRLVYGAGSPDRIDYGRTFVKLDPVPFWILRFGNHVFGSSKRGFTKFDERSLRRALASTKNLRDDLASGKIDQATYRRQLASLVKTALVEARRPVSERLVRDIAGYFTAREAWRKSLSRADTRTVVRNLRSGRADLAGSTAQPKAFAALPVYPIPGLVVEVELDESNKLEELVEEAIAYWKAHARLGVLFQERTRIRSTNQIFGEPIYQLALTPGEEVQIRQVSETKRRTSFSEIQDRQAEEETAFSSTWSTDMASTISSQQSFQQSTNIGANASGQVPEVPVSVSGNVASSTTNADNESINDTITTRRARTETATARMRQQHRVQIELATEDTRSLSTTRTLRNVNQQRSLLHTFFKIYRKEQVTLERHGAQLCLRLVVDDPARVTRSVFRANLNKVDPEVLAHRNVTPPVPEISHEFHSTFTATDEDGGFFHGTRVARARTRQFRLRSEAQAPDGYVLTEPPRFIMTRCETYFYVNPLHSTDPDADFDPSAVPEDQTTEVIPNVWVGWQYCRNGGRVQWRDEPRVDVEDPVAELRVELPLYYTAPSLLGEREMEIASVRFRIETTWGPGDQARADYLNAVQAERLRLIGDFRPEHITQLHEIAEADYPSTVLDRALSEGLRYPPGFEFHRVKDLFDLESVVIENVPYWSDPSSRAEHDDLMLRLQRLPAQLELHQILTDSLTAAQAVVYVPIKVGAEEEALKLLPEAEGSAPGIAAEIKSFRDQHYGPIRQFVPPNLDQHRGPSPTLATPAGSSDWASDWERPQAKFDILGQWSELVPTDGVHVETHLSSTVCTDENERNRLVRIALQV